MYSRNTITRQAAQRLIIGLGLFVVILGYSSTRIYQFVLEKAAHGRALDLETFYISRLDQLEREWELDARTRRVRIEYARILENSTTSTVNLKAFLTIQGGDHRYAHLLVQDRKGSMIFSSGKDEATILPSQTSTQELDWQFNQKTGELFRVFSEPIWLGKKGMGKLITFYSVNNALLRQFAMPGITLTALYKDQIVSSSLGEQGIKSMGFVSTGAERAEHRLLSWRGIASDPVILKVDAPVKGLFSPLELSISVSIVPILDALILWFVLGTWLMRNSRRIKMLGDAVRLFTRHNEVTDELSEKLHQSMLSSKDEISDVALAVEELATRSVEQEIIRKTIDSELRQHRDHLEELIQVRTAELEILQEELKERAAIASGIFETAPVAMLMVDTQGIIMRANSEAETMFGYQHGELSGKQLEMLMPETYRLQHHTLRSNFSAHPIPRKMGEGRELFGLRANNESFPVEVALGPMRLNNENYVITSILDVTTRKQAQLALKNSEATLTRAQAVAQIGSWHLDFANGKLNWTDETFRIFGKQKNLQITYEVFLACVHSDDRSAVDTAWQSAIQGGSYDIEHRIIVDGQVRWVKEQAQIEVASDGTPLSGVGTVQDITLRKQAELALLAANEALELLATTDPLTGLLNRRALQHRAEASLNYSKRYGTPFSVILFDLDFFKSINDTMGHDVGDMVLKEVSQRILCVLRDSDILARWGGEEFLVLATQSGLEETGRLAERLRNILADEPVVPAGKITASFGVAGNLDGESLEQVIQKADIAMYTAKQNGRNRVVIA